jgi:hypothetical protein
MCISTRMFFHSGPRSQQCRERRRRTQWTPCPSTMMCPFSTCPARRALCAVRVSPPVHHSVRCSSNCPRRQPRVTRPSLPQLRLRRPEPMHHRRPLVSICLRSTPNLRHRHHMLLRLLRPGRHQTLRHRPRLPHQSWSPHLLPPRRRPRHRLRGSTQLGRPRRHAHRRRHPVLLRQTLLLRRPPYPRIRW